MKSAYLNGEVAVLDTGGVSSFEALQEALGRSRKGSLSYVVFDILHLDGKDLRDLPLVERKAILEKLLKRPPAGIAYSQHITGQGPEFYKIACGRHWKASSPSAPTRPIDRAAAGIGRR